MINDLANSDDSNYNDNESLQQSTPYLYQY